eukprot:3033456-Karenia_brevis.AAC.1
MASSSEYAHASYVAHSKGYKYFKDRCKCAHKLNDAQDGHLMCYFAKTMSLEHAPSSEVHDDDGDDDD